MTKLLTAAQMRAIEKAAIDSGEETGLELMERAGRGVVEAVFEEWPELAAGTFRAVVLCGPGNNGGDGFVVARLLKEWGWEVEVFLYGDPEKLPPDARVNYERWGELGATHAAKDFAQPLLKGDLLFDGVFGTGLTRALTGEVSGLMRAIDEARGTGNAERLIAIDIPSGLCADSGKNLGQESSTWLRADLTVSFHSEKPGHRLAEGPELCGIIKVVDIGLMTGSKTSRGALSNLHGTDGPASKFGRVVARRTSRETLYSYLGKENEEHKYSHGYALILTGDAGKTGAARLAARGSLRIGAGLVTLGVPESAAQEVAGQITALMMRRVEDGADLVGILQDERINALCLGPGMGLERARDLVTMACASVAPRATVLDADALTAFADAPDVLFGMLHEKCVLTPHAGEFARLFPDIAAKLNAPATKGPAYSKVDATRAAAARAGCVVLFKGPDTVIADPDGRCSINSAHYERAAPWLATAGSGDVLAGFITGLLARGLSPMQAAETAAWLHVECARSFGPGLIAEDLPEELPKVFRALGIA